MATDVVEQKNASAELARLLGSRYKVGRHLGLKKFIDSRQKSGYRINPEYILIRQG